MQNKVILGSIFFLIAAVGILAINNKLQISRNDSVSDRKISALEVDSTVIKQIVIHINKQEGILAQINPDSPKEELFKQIAELRGLTQETKIQLDRALANQPEESIEAK